jgi:hypothetical protein
MCFPAHLMQVKQILDNFVAEEMVHLYYGQKLTVPIDQLSLTVDQKSLGSQVKNQI